MNANQSSVKGNHGRSSFVGFFSAFSALGALLCALPGFTLDNAACSAAKDDGKDLVPYTGKGYVLTFDC